jgi:LEA14-like dessication related protein
MRIGTRVALGLTALCVAIVAVGCSATPRSIVTPRVQVTQLSSFQSGGSGQRFRVELLIDNQNPEPLPIEEVRFNLRLTGQGVLSGHYMSPVTVEALDRRTVSVEVDGDALSSLSQLRAAAGAGNTMPYEIFGNITLDRAFQNTLPFTGNGAVPLAPVSER